MSNEAGGTGQPRTPAGTMSGGHSVIVVGVPELEHYIRGRTAHYDPSFLAADPAFAHAHITLLGPWLSNPSRTDLETVASIMATAEPFEATLTRVETFPDGVIYLRPEPNAPFRALTATLVEAFPQYPPYAGRFPNPVAHLTLDRQTETITPETIEADLGDLLPARLHVDRVDLQWWANHDCHVRKSWKLGDARSLPSRR